jgi:hypothetical protein
LEDSTDNSYEIGSHQPPSLQGDMGDQNIPITALPQIVQRLLNLLAEYPAPKVPTAWPTLYRETMAPPPGQSRGPINPQRLHTCQGGIDTCRAQHSVLECVMT